MRMSVLNGTMPSLRPVSTQFLIEFRPAFFGQEDPCAWELHTTLSAGDCFSKPTRPFHVEVNVVRSPDNERWDFQRLQSCFDGQRVFVVEGRKETLEVTKTLFCFDQRSKISFDAVVTQLFRVLIGWS